MNKEGLEKDKKIFGAVYEKLTDRETRKAMGMFYTPDFIVDYILKYTVLELDVLNNPFVKILDPSCGAGYFLVKAYDILMNKFKQNLIFLRERYAEEIYCIEYIDEYEIVNKNEEKNNITKNIKGADYWVEENLHYHILKNCLYGVDVDPIAIEITKKNLKDKDNKKEVSPMNIVLCDSLLKWEEAISPEKLEVLSDILKKQYINKGYKCLSDCEIKKVIYSLRDFWNNEFDYIIGNPPYVMLLQSEIEENYWRYILENYKTVGYKKNIFYLLIERVLQKLKNEGKHGFIIPDRYFLANSYIESRKNLVNNTKIINITQFSRKIFEEAIVGTAVYIVEKNKYDNNHKINLKLEYMDENSFCHTELYQGDISKNKNFILNILTRSEYQSIIKKIKENSIELKNFCKIHVGMMIKDKDKNFRDALFKEEKSRIVVGRDLKEYVVEDENRYCCIEDLKIFGGTKNLKKHFTYPKILLRKTGNSIIASLDNKGVLVEQSVYMVIPFNNDQVYGLLGQIQSNLCNFYFKEYLITNPDAYPYIQHYDVERIPINLKILDDFYGEIIRKIIYIKSKIKEIRFNEVIANNSYDRILYMYKEKKDKQINLELKLQSYIKESNNIVYKAYGLKEYEIDLIESCSNGISSVIVDNKKEKFNDTCTSIEDIKSYYSPLINEIYITLESEVIELLKFKGRYLSIKELESGLKSKLRNFKDLLKIIREFDIKKENDHVIKEILNNFSDSWKKYLKSKGSGRQSKNLVKYGKEEYGLSSWSEEIHNIWFKEKNGA